jgi:hypothetical protein
MPAVVSADCCVGRVGDANGSGDDWPTIGDISVIIDMLFISGQEVACLAEADYNQSGGCNPTRADITIGDIALFIDCSYVCTGTPEYCMLPCLTCPPASE